ncbi:nucleotidyltransferase family protein [Gordonia polyisoprenivorans]|uniref:nucleotidyltransferase family protein n=1 Tax=Gordonia polyisoprenivorans TaxID=84595 RepID=UPI0023018A5C|nr:NTP transferase domain-containing protein [Gordonia polyisoprenivorans]WCB39233.1 NTP transferase domain-containing protein [Gordonia polyisoprenivorans]
MAEVDAMVVGAVLAAGSGRRYGKPKITAEQGLWLDNAVHALSEGGCREVVVAMGAAIVTPPSGAKAIVVEDWVVGLSASVRAVLCAPVVREDSGGVVLHVVDMPDVTAAVVSRIVKTAAGAPGKIVRAVYHGRPGHPVHLDAGHLDGVLASLDGDVGAARYLRAHPEIVESVECGDLASGVDRDEP